MSMEVGRAVDDPRGLLFIGVLVGFWWLLTSGLGLFPEFILPSPEEVWRSAIELGFPSQPQGAMMGYGTSLWGHIADSTLRLLGAFAIAAGIAIPLGVLMAMVPSLGAALDPFVQGFRPIPPIAWTPLAILWFGIGLQSVLFIIVLGAFWPILLNTIAGVRETQPLLIRAGKCLGASSYQVFARIMIPAAMPFIFTGVRSGITVGWWMIVPAEMIASQSGLGFLITRARENGQTQHVITGMIAIALVGYGLHLILQHLARLRLFRGA